MSNIFFSQYDKMDYPLKKFTVNEIPENLLKIVCVDEKTLDSTIRGGLAYSLLTKSVNYVLSDIDLIYLHSDLNFVIEFYSRLADDVFINHNTFSNTVLTAFWRSAKGDYYKIDALITENFPPTISVKWRNHSIKSVNCLYLWHDRLLKISQKNIRKLNEKKIKNHISVVKNLTKYLLDDDTPISSNFPCDVEILIREAVKVANDLLVSSEAESLKKMLEYFLIKMRSQHESIILPT